jgi:hypothetical protein
MGSGVKDGPAAGALHCPMAKVLPQLTDGLRAFIERQHVFFVATAPLAGGRVNVSPKGLHTFRVFGPTSVGYLDLTGSGIETAAHVRDNGRITFMFCAVEGPPLILRLYGRGRVVLPADPEWASFATAFPVLPGIRSIVLAELDRVQTSCGEAVPLYSYVGDRDDLVRWAAKKGPEGLETYRRDKNVASIDGLPTPLTPSGVA